MRTKIKLPRILKINWIDGLNISVVFNNGESRTINFNHVLKKLGISKRSPAGILYKPQELSKVIVNNNTLSWNNVIQYITLRNKEKKLVPFEIGADILLKFSIPDHSVSKIQIGKKIKQARLKSGLTQEELAKMSGTTRTYISRIENDRSDIELSTLQKIIETGLGMHLQIVIK